MKTRAVMIAALLSLVTGAAILPMGCGKDGRQHEDAKIASYHCPMHPAVVSDKPGDCPICGMRLVPIEAGPKNSATAPSSAMADKKIMYRSTMTPGEISNKPGKDSMGMDMAPFEVTTGGEQTPSGLAAVSITPAARERMGVTLGTVEKHKLAREIRTSARIVPDETLLYHVTVKIDGYVEKLFTATTGEFVKEGEPLLTVYSPMLVSAQEEYLNVVKDNAELAAAAKKRLQLWDITDAQIARLEKSGKPDRVLTLFAPASGWIMERNISSGHRVMAGEQLLVLGNLSNVWADADIFQSDMPYVKTGMPVELVISAVPNKPFAGNVSFVSPVLDAETRTVKVRMQVPNPDLLLKPEMYAVARLSYNLGEKLAIPESAVMQTGERVYVFRDTGDGRLVPTEIKIGARSDGWFEVLAGIDEGARVVTSANFLVDSESSMKAALEAVAGK